MKPDRTNYELWIIDWLDGKLDQCATSMLMAFLENNPDLREEAESLSLSRLNAGETIYQAKETLKKTASELPLSQVEFLSVAYLENDITPGQMSDLEQSIALKYDNKITFETIQKTRLFPPQIIYKKKNSLKKQTTGVKVFRFVSIGLSAAATIAILILSYVFIPGYLSQKDRDEENIIVSDADNVPPFVVRARILKAPPEEPAGRDLEKISFAVISQSSVLAVADTFVTNTRPFVNEIKEVPVILIPVIVPEISGLHLAATNNNFSPDIYDEDRSMISRFFARNFRERILKDTVVNDSPLKSYEIAEAGIDGLNRLLGWEMALVKNTDEEGELKSIYFSSRVLKFNAPVKKTEPLP